MYRATVSQPGEDEPPARGPRVGTPRAHALRALGPWWSPRTRHQWRSPTDLVMTGRSVYAASTSLRENRTRGIYCVSRPRPSSQALRLMLREPRTPGSRRPDRPLLSDRVADASRLHQIMQPDCQKASSFFLFGLERRLNVRISRVAWVGPSVKTETFCPATNQDHRLIFKRLLARR